MSVCRRKFIVAMTCVIILPTAVWAKVGKPVREQVRAQFPSAVAHEGLVTAQSPLESDKLRGFVVLEKDGLPAEKAYWFIKNQDYEYRPVVIEGDALSTRPGKVYTYLKRGLVMVISDLEFSGNTVYLKLLSLDPVAREGKLEKHPSRVGTMVGFRFPGDVARDDAAAVLQTINAWLKPFPTRESAIAYAAQMLSSK